MTPQEQIDALRAKHASLERAIEDEAHRPLPDNVAVNSLKREKLKIKDEIFRLSKT